MEGAEGEDATDSTAAQAMAWGRNGGVWKASGDRRETKGGGILNLHHQEVAPNSSLNPLGGTPVRPGLTPLRE